MKASAQAPASIALIKYWGRKDDVLRLPINGSLAVNLDGLVTTTTVQFFPEHEQDVVTIDGQREEGEVSRAVKHLDRIRKLAGLTYKAVVESRNSFPSRTGLSSSSSGFAALTVAGAKAAGLQLTERELSILARQGSGSACRSIPPGFVEWLDGDSSETSYAHSLHPPEYWNIADLVAIVSTEKKDVSSSEGHATATSSPFYAARQERIRRKISDLKMVLEQRNFQQFGRMIEAETLEFHAITMTSDPSLLYLLPNSVRLMKIVRQWRQEGLSVFFNLNTGQDVHIFCEGKDVEAVQKKLEELDFVRDIIVNKPARGAHLIDQHLF